MHYAARELHIIGHSYQDGALRRARHKAESLTKMIIGGRAALNLGASNFLVLVVGDLRAKIIKRKDLDQPSVGASREVLVWRGHGQTSLGITQSRRCEHQAAPELITRFGGVCDIGDVLSQPNAWRHGGASGGEELHAAGIGRAPDVFGGDSDRHVSRVAGPYAVHDLAEGVIVLRGAGDVCTVLVVRLPSHDSGVEIVDDGERAGVGDLH